MRLPMLLAVSAVALARVASADIYEWTDSGGARHFTNHRESVPAAQREAARVLIADLPRADPAPAVADPVERSPAPAAAPAAVERESLEDAYRAGLAAGQQIGVGGGGGGGGGAGGVANGGTVEIYGPLAVATAESRDSTPYVAPGFGWYGGGLDYYPFITTGFDRGRSRHQTLRMLLQDQFAIDREGPFAYDRWTQPGVGPALAPFLPRGLPLPTQQFGRVVYR
ncbi:MAG: DUF4124 domain-containing protein [Deltaproteobacteria bacterium]|nr:DUF4124 domain-containing protein [Deltaproteobacteria bacterium]